LITTTLIDCKAAILCAAGSRVRAFITNVENAKKTPAISPQPSAETRVRPSSQESLIGVRTLARAAGTGKHVVWTPY